MRAPISPCIGRHGAPERVAWKARGEERGWSAGFAPDGTLRIAPRRASWPRPVHRRGAPHRRAAGRPRDRHAGRMAIVSALYALAIVSGVVSAVADAGEGRSSPCARRAQPQAHVARRAQRDRHREPAVPSGHGAERGGVRHARPDLRRAGKAVVYGELRFEQIWKASGPFQRDPPRSRGRPRGCRCPRSGARACAGRGLAPHTLRFREAGTAGAAVWIAGRHAVLHDAPSAGFVRAGERGRRPAAAHRVPCGAAIELDGLGLGLLPHCTSAPWRRHVAGAISSSGWPGPFFSIRATCCGWSRAGAAERGGARVGNAARVGGWPRARSACRWAAWPRCRSRWRPRKWLWAWQGEVLAPWRGMSITRCSWAAWPGPSCAALRAGRRRVALAGRGRGPAVPLTSIAGWLLPSSGSWLRARCAGRGRHRAARRRCLCLDGAAHGAPRRARAGGRRPGRRRTSAGRLSLTRSRRARRRRFPQARHAAVRQARHAPNCKFL